MLKLTNLNSNKLLIKNILFQAIFKYVMIESQGTTFYKTELIL